MADVLPLTFDMVHIEMAGKWMEIRLNMAIVGYWSIPIFKTCQLYGCRRFDWFHHQPDRDVTGRPAGCRAVSPKNIPWNTYGFTMGLLWVKPPRITYNNQPKHKNTPEVKSSEFLVVSPDTPAAGKTWTKFAIEAMANWTLMVNISRAENGVFFWVDLPSDKMLDLATVFVNVYQRTSGYISIPSASQFSSCSTAAASSLLRIHSRRSWTTCSACKTGDDSTSGCRTHWVSGVWVIMIII